MKEERAQEVQVISEQVYIEQYKKLQQDYWGLQLDFQNQYDFGLILLDTEPIKKQLLTKIKTLIDKLAKDLLSQFVEKMEELFKRFKDTEEKITVVFNTIDEIIEQIDYVTRIFKNDVFIDEMATQMELLCADKEFLDNLNLKLDQPDFDKYLRMHVYPNDLRRIIQNKNNNIDHERERINTMLQEDIGNVTQMIADCKNVVENLKKMGLQNLPELQAEA